MHFQVRLVLRCLHSRVCFEVAARIVHSQKRLWCQQCKTVPVSFSSACAPALPCSLCFRHGFSHSPGQRRHADIAQTLRLQQSSLACVTSPAPIRCTDIGMDKSTDKGADHGATALRTTAQPMSNDERNRSASEEATCENGEGMQPAARMLAACSLRPPFLLRQAACHACR